MQQTFLYVAVPLLRDGKPWAVVRVSRPATAVDEALNVFEQRLAWGAAGTVAIILAASWLITRRISQPLEIITRGARLFGQGNLEHRLPVEGSREIATLAETLNNVATQLHEQIQASAVERSHQDAVLSSMEEGVLTVDNDRRILDVNHAATQMFSLDAEKVRGRPIYEVLRKADVLRFFEEAFAGELPMQENIVIFDKQRRQLTAYGSELRNAQGKRIGVLGVFRDITPRG